MNLNKFTQRSIDAIQYAQQMAQAEQHPQLLPEHLLTALLKQEDGMVPQILKRVGANIETITDEVDDALKTARRARPAGRSIRRTISRRYSIKAEKELKQFKDEYVSVEHLLLAMLEVKSKAQEILKAQRRQAGRAAQGADVDSRQVPVSPTTTRNQNTRCSRSTRAT